MRRYINVGNINNFLLLIIFISFLPVTAHAELKPLSDAQLGNEVAQAAVAVDTIVSGTNSFTRFTTGLNVDFQTNINTVDLGNITKTGITNTSDFQASNLSFGHISKDGAKVQLDGKLYAPDQIVPFQGVDPYIEIAQSSGSIVGFRMGFTSALGTLSGNIASMSGNIHMKIDDGSGVIKDAQLLNAAGTADNYRSSYIGLSTPTTNCATLVNCNAISAIKSFDIGAKQTTGTITAAKDFFLSFQKQAVAWSSVGGTGTVTASPGFFINIPTTMQLTTAQLQTGIPRLRTEYIDRGLGLF